MWGYSVESVGQGAPWEVPAMYMLVEAALAGAGPAGEVPVWGGSRGGAAGRWGACWDLQ